MAAKLGGYSAISGARVPPETLPSAPSRLLGALNTSRPTVITAC